MNGRRFLLAASLLAALATFPVPTLATPAAAAPLRFGVIAEEANEPDRMLRVYAALLGEMRTGLAPRGIEVAPEHRRQGLARTVMAALLEWGAERGATTAYLQVLGHNAPALALYDGMGFTTHHAYAYLTPGP